MNNLSARPNFTSLRAPLVAPGNRTASMLYARWISAYNEGAGGLRPVPHDPLGNDRRQSAGSIFLLFAALLSSSERYEPVSRKPKWYSPLLLRLFRCALY